MSAQDTRSQIVEAADQLFYAHGFEATSFAHIAEAVKLSRGNFYYHFKSKDEILRAVIERRLSSTQSMLAEWEQSETSAIGRVKQFVQILITNETKIMAYGCPVGTLCDELAKLDHKHMGHAVEVFTLFREWLKEQFSKLGYGPEADALALHVLMRSQGIATLATAFREEDFVRKEVDDLNAWLDSLSADK